MVLLEQASAASLENSVAWHDHLASRRVIIGTIMLSEFGKQFPVIERSWLGPELLFIDITFTR